MSNNSHDGPDYGAIHTQAHWVLEEAPQHPHATEWTVEAEHLAGETVFELFDEIAHLKDRINRYAELVVQMRAMLNVDSDNGEDKLS